MLVACKRFLLVPRRNDMRGGEELFFFYRNTKPKITAISQRAVGTNLAAMAMDNFRTDIQAEAQAWKLVAQRIYTVIAVKQMR